jgi:parallel beta-helix repeat protein
MSIRHPHGDETARFSQRQQISFIFFDLGAMNVIAGVGASFYLIPLLALGFRASSFWLGLLFIVAGFASWKMRRLPVIVPLVIIGIDLWNTVRMLPLYERYGYVVMAQTSFVLPLVFVLTSMLRARLKRGLFKKPDHSDQAPSMLTSTKDVLALLTSMLVSVGTGLGLLVLFSGRFLTWIAESPNPLVNMFHDAFVIPALLLLFPLGAALGELIWLRVGSLYLTRHEVSIFIRYVKQFPLISILAARFLRREPETSVQLPAAIELNNFAVQEVSQIGTPEKAKRLRHAIWLAPLSLSVALLMLVGPFRAVAFFNKAEPSEPEIAAQPGMLVVSQSGRGKYRSIGAALANAAPGMTIVVRRGVYPENILIDKPITLMGDEKGGQTVIECEQDGCVKLATDGAKVQNLTVRAQVGFLARWLGGGRAVAIAVFSGHPIIDNCDVSSNRGPGIVVSGAGSDPEIRNTKIHDCYLNGVLFTNNSRGSIENSEISQNGWAGIRSDSGSKPVIRNSKIHHGLMDGVLIAAQGFATLQDCDVFDNNYNGIALKESSSVNLNHSRVFNQKSDGLLVRDHSSARIDECDVFGNASSAIEIADQSDAQVLKTKVHNGQKAGIVVWRHSTATVEDSLIYENASTGMFIADASKPIVRRSVFRSHFYTAIDVGSGADPVFDHCQVYGGHSSGIYFHDGGNGSVDDCSIFGNANANVYIASGSNPQFRRTTLSDSQQAGVLVTEGGQGVIADCKIFNNYIGIEIKENGAPTVQHCYINNNRHQGATADSSSAGSIMQSELKGNADGAWRIESGSRLVREQNLEL